MVSEANTENPRRTPFPGRHSKNMVADNWQWVKGAQPWDK
jgi:hypothetical protein